MRRGGEKPKRRGERESGVGGRRQALKGCSRRPRLPLHDTSPAVLLLLPLLLSCHSV